MAAGRQNLILGGGYAVRRKGKRFAKMVLLRLKVFARREGDFPRNYRGPEYARKGKKRGEPGEIDARAENENQLTRKVKSDAGSKFSSHREIESKKKGI